MPQPIPFPLPFRLGTDICRVSRVSRLLRSPRRAAFIRRILTEEERTRARKILEPFMGEEEELPAPLREGRLVAHTNAPYFMAGRFAAKEAVMKAVDERRLGWHDIVIRGGKGGRPFAVIKGVEEDGEMDREALLSISHDGDYATAVCIAATPEVYPEESRRRKQQEGGDEEAEAEELEKMISTSRR